MNMRVRVVAISLSEDEYEMYRSMAKVEGKKFSKFVRDKIKEAVRHDMREVNLLNRLIRLIEDLPEKLQLSVVNRGSGEEEFSQLIRLLLYLIKLFEKYSEYTIVMEAKRKEFQVMKEELKRALGVEV
jgi:hypothetical protein